MTYDINSVTASSAKKAVVNADITLIDASQVMQKYIENIAVMVSSPEYQNNLATMTKEDYQKTYGRPACKCAGERRSS